MELKALDSNENAGEVQIKPYHHSCISAKRYGGVWQDYEKIHSWFDQTKACHPDMRHRAILHNSLGPYLAEQVFGVIITNSDGKEIPTRSIAEDHIIEDLGFIPAVSDYLNLLQKPGWIYGEKKRSRVKEILPE